MSYFSFTQFIFNHDVRKWPLNKFEKRRNQSLIKYIYEICEESNNDGNKNN